MRVGRLCPFVQRANAITLWHRMLMIQKLSCHVPRYLHCTYLHRPCMQCNSWCCQAAPCVLCQHCPLAIRGCSCTRVPPHIAGAKLWLQGKLWALVCSPPSQALPAGPCGSTASATSGSSLWSISLLSSFSPLWMWQIKLQAAPLRSSCQLHQAQKHLEMQKHHLRHTGHLIQSWRCACSSAHWISGASGRCGAGCLLS